jgi:PilZ domain
MSMPSDVLKDKRRMQRFAIALPSQIETNGENASVLSLLSRDVCAGGGFYLVDNPLPVGTQVKVKMVMKIGAPELSGVTGSQISVSGTVIRTDADGMAVCFNKRYNIMSV